MKLVPMKLPVPNSYKFFMQVVRVDGHTTRARRVATTASALVALLTDA